MPPYGCGAPPHLCRKQVHFLPYSSFSHANDLRFLPAGSSIPAFARSIAPNVDDLQAHPHRKGAPVVLHNTLPYARAPGSPAAHKSAIHLKNNEHRADELQNPNTRISACPLHHSRHRHGCAQAAGNASLSTQLSFHSRRPHGCGLPARSQESASW